MPSPFLDLEKRVGSLNPAYFSRELLVKREKFNELSKNITDFLSMEANSENLSIVSIDKRVTNLQANGSRPSSLLGTVLK
jgi:hypothetical protein